MAKSNIQKIGAIPGLLLAVSFLGVPVQAQTEEDGDPFAPNRVEVMVVGCPHLKQIDSGERPAIDVIRRELARFEPDQVVVEWLHPSIDPATTENYRPGEDLGLLARLWGYDPTEVKAALSRTREILETQKQHGLPTAATRVELGKLYYLNRDRLNAGFQWWIARGSGAAVADLERLTRQSFDGHELEVWGFPIALDQGLEYITPFDYQGKDAAWIWMDIVQQVALHAVAEKHGLNDGDEGWEEALAEYGGGLKAHVDEGDPSWLAEYGDIVEVAEFAEVIDAWYAGKKAPRPEPDPGGVSLMRRIQSPEAGAEKRRMYDEIYPKITLYGLGRQLVDNWVLRNSRMVDFLEQDARRMDSTRVLVLVGEGHKVFLEQELQERGYRVVSSLEYIP